MRFSSENSIFSDYFSVLVWQGGRCSEIIEFIIEKMLHEIIKQKMLFGPNSLCTGIILYLYYFPLFSRDSVWNIPGTVELETTIQPSNQNVVGWRIVDSLQRSQCKSTGEWRKSITSSQCISNSLYFASLTYWLRKCVLSMLLDFDHGFANNVQQMLNIQTFDSHTTHVIRVISLKI